MHEMEQAANDPDISSCSSCGTKTYDLVGSLIDPSADICMGCAKREDMQMQGSRKQAGKGAWTPAAGGGERYSGNGWSAMVYESSDGGYRFSITNPIGEDAGSGYDRSASSLEEAKQKALAAAPGGGRTSRRVIASGGVNYNGQDYVMGMTGADATCIVCNTHFPSGAEGFVKPGEGGTKGATFVCRWDAQDIQAQGSKTATNTQKVRARDLQPGMHLIAPVGATSGKTWVGPVITKVVNQLGSTFVYTVNGGKMNMGPADLVEVAPSWPNPLGETSKNSVKQAAFRQRVQANLRTAAYEDDYDSAGDAYAYEDQDGRKFTDRDIEEVKLMARDYEAWSNL
jgi:hypothetical protein